MQDINLIQLSSAFIPVLLVLLIFLRWSLSIKQSIYALARMLSQLLLVGYALNIIFNSDDNLFILSILSIMCLASSWIALNALKHQRLKLYKYAFLSISIGGSLTILCITQGTLDLTPWYAPHYMVPISGMVFSSAMNSVSLAAERLQAELDNHHDFTVARNTAFSAAMIPVINSLFAVGLVSLPGMMTGQILSGTSPFIAARYQIMVMAMVFGASGLAAALYLRFVQSFYNTSAYKMEAL